MEIRADGLGLFRGLSLGRITRKQAPSIREQRFSATEIAPTPANLCGEFLPILFGEILYRLSSNLLDDRTTGAERFFREFGAAILSPGRFFSRLFQGKLTRITPQEVYQKEPLNVTLAAGPHWFNKETDFGTGSVSALFNIHLDYGDPFEIRTRKPFDFLKLRLDLSYGKNVGDKYLDNVTGYGLLFGQTVHSGNLGTLIGAFQHYDTGTVRFSRSALWASVEGSLPSGGCPRVLIFNPHSISGSCPSPQAIHPRWISWKPGSISGIMIIPVEVKPSSRAL